ncbi:Cytochrome c oxidase subunit 6B1 [Coelomomyces lativittatus]|nr:Cytochrome c oxidase subunit 6B1 [Coelomomyces lativittatus]
MPSGEEIYKKSIVPKDDRYPNTNQTNHCWKNYVDYHRCVEEKGEDYPACLMFKRFYNNYCPSLWIERWDALKERGVCQVLARPETHS